MSGDTCEVLGDPCEVSRDTSLCAKIVKCHESSDTCLYTKICQVKLVSAKR